MLYQGEVNPHFTSPLKRYNKQIILHFAIAFITHLIVTIMVDGSEVMYLAFLN